MKKGSSLLALAVLILAICRSTHAQCTANTLPFPDPSIFRFEKQGYSTDLEDNENYLVLTGDCIAAGTIKGVAWMSENNVAFSVDFYDSTTAAAATAVSEAIATTDFASSAQIQVKCFAAPRVVGTNVDLAISVANQAGNDYPVKRAYVATPSTGVEYPCDKQLIGSNANKQTLKKFNAATGATIDTTGADIEPEGRYAIMAITDSEFVYKCICADDSDCNTNDCNMYCATTNICTCKADYTYDVIAHKCVYADFAMGKPSYSSPAQDPDTAPLAVDDSFPTCAVTEYSTTPKLVFDLEESVTVFSVRVKIPLPLSSAVVLTGTGGTGGTETMYGSSLTTGLGTVTNIAFKAGFIVLLTAASGDTFLLNRAMETKDHSENAPFGTIGDQVQEVALLTLVGTITNNDGSLCITDAGGSAATSPTACASFYIIGDNTNGVAIKVLNGAKQDQELQFPSTAVGAVGTVGAAGTTTFKLHDGGGAIDLAAATTTPFVLYPSNTVGTNCVVLNADGTVKLSATCDDELKFVSHPSIPDMNELYRYELIDADNAGTGDDKAATYTPSFNTQPCAEVESIDTSPADFLASFDTLSNSAATIDFLKYVSPAVVPVAATEEKDLLVRATTLGLSNFKIMVGSTYDSATGDTSSFSECLTYAGYPVHGDVDDNVYHCSTPQTGQYVSIESADNSDTRRFSVCEFNVNVATTVTGIGALCKTVDDCLCPSTNKADQHMECKKDADTDPTGICQCMPGYHFWTDANLCINYDECENSTVHNCDITEDEANGLTDGTCVDTPGSFYCECPEGYEYDTTDGGCKDINELLENNCGCQGTCTNKIPNVDGNLKYVCTCDASPFDSGYKLGSDGHSCVATDPCEPTDCGFGTAPIPGECLMHVISPAEFNWECICDPGYEFTSQAIGCEDVDECTIVGTDPRAHNCDHTCTNTAGSYTCDCDEGYDLDADDKTSCIDVNECADVAKQEECIIDRGIFSVADFGNNVQDATCTNIPGSYTCTCPDGYAKPETSGGCLDIKECDTNKGGCEGDCEEKNMVDDMMKYLCTCGTGFQLNDNGHSCDDVDECTTTEVALQHNCAAGSTNAVGSGEADVQATCVNTHGSFQCMCEKGYELGTGTDGKPACMDINECNLDMPPCEHTCANTNGGFTCSCSSAGFQLLGDKVSCQDIDECVKGTDICDQNSVCHNELGDYRCVCNPGYKLTDTLRTCENVNECELDNQGGCDQVCTDEEGSYKCSCTENYFLLGDNHSCDDKDECADPADNQCEHKCVNIKNGYMCECNAGYALNADKFNCDNVNECDSSNNNGGCEQGCVDNDGSYECTCGAGYTLNINKHSCDDINECEGSSNGCDQHCYNSPGSFKCGCDGNYLLASDGKQCLMNRNLKMEFCMDYPYVPEFDSMSSEESRAFITDIQNNALAIASSVNEQAQQGAFQFQVSRIYRCPVDKTGFDLLATPRDDISENDLANFASDVAGAFKDSPLSVDGVDYELISEPAFVFYDGSSTNTAEINTPCDYFNAIDYCKNEADCVIASGGSAQCRCPSGLSGPQCLDSGSSGLTDIELGLIVALPLLVLLFTLIGVGTIVMMRRNRPVEPFEYIDEQPQSLAMQPNYLTNGDYGVYGYYK